jgi:UDP-glucose 4-epimerase
MTRHDEPTAVVDPAAVRRVLVTGGCGFIGAHVVAALRERGVAVTVLDDESIGDRGALAGRDVALHLGDVRDSAAVDRAMSGHDAVVHLAAMPDLASANRDPMGAMDVNVRGSLAVLEAARRHGVHRVLAASSGGTVLGGAPPPVRADVAPAPRSPLGAAKLAMEGYLHAYAGTHGMVTCALRLANVYGPGCATKDSVIARFLRHVADGRPIEVHGDGTQARDFVVVADVADGIVRALLAGATGTYQLGSGGATSVNALLDVIARVVDRPLPPRRYVPARAGDVHTTYCDIAGARAVFGYDPVTPLAEGIKRTWTWMKHDVESRERRRMVVFAR